MTFGFGPAQQPLPVIKRSFDAATGRWKWIATSPEPDWSSRWVVHRHPSIRLMFKAHQHARWLNALEDKARPLVHN